MDSLSSQARAFEEAEHFGSTAILERQAALAQRYMDLQKPLERQKSRLAASNKLQHLFRDLEDEEVWMKERVAAASSTNVGKPVRTHAGGRGVSTVT